MDTPSYHSEDIVHCYLPTSRAWRVLPALAILFCILTPKVQATENAQSAIRLAVLDFELNDLTLQPGNPAELERTASIAPMLREAFAAKPGYQVIEISATAQAKADVAFGYLFDHTNLAADLGATHDADWILIGRLHKPSFLFAYMMGRLVKVESGELLGDYLVEVKGSTRKLTQRGVNNLAERVVHTIDKQTGR